MKKIWNNPKKHFPKRLALMERANNFCLLSFILIKFQKQSKTTCCLALSLQPKQYHTIGVSLQCGFRLSLNRLSTNSYLYLIFNQLWITLIYAEKSWLYLNIIYRLVVAIYKESYFKTRSFQVKLIRIIFIEWIKFHRRTICIINAQRKNKTTNTQQKIEEGSNKKITLAPLKTTTVIENH